MTQLCLIILLIFKKVKEKMLSNIEPWGTIDIVLDIQCDILYHRKRTLGKNNAKHCAPSSALIKFKDFVPTLYAPYLENQYESIKDIAGKFPADLLF